MDYEQSNQEEPGELDMFERRAKQFRTLHGGRLGCFRLRNLDPGLRTTSVADCTAPFARVG